MVPQQGRTAPGTLNVDDMPSLHDLMGEANVNRER